MKRFSITRVMVMEYLRREKELSGYSFMKYCRKIGIPMSSGMLYPFLRELKAEGMIVERQEGRKKIYTLSEKGWAVVEKVGGGATWIGRFRKYFYDLCITWNG